MFGLLFGIIGLVFSLVFHTASGTTKVAYGTTKLAVGTAAAGTRITLGLALRNLVRAAAFGLVGYLVYELVIGYSQGKAKAEAAAKAAAPAPTPAPRPTSAPAPRPADATSTQPAPAARAPIVGGTDHAGRPVQVDDGSGTHHTTRVGRGVVRR